MKNSFLNQGNKVNVSYAFPLKMFLDFKNATFKVKKFFEKVDTKST